MEMETIEEHTPHSESNEKKKKKNTTTTTSTTTIIPNEIIFFDILTRLPVKSLLQFRCVSKLWSSFILNPSFTNHHLSRSIDRRTTHFGILIAAFNRRSLDHHFLSATHIGGQATHLFKLSDWASPYTLSEHVNGLFLIHRNGFKIVNDSVRIFNPSTREIVELPYTDPIVFSHSVQNHVCYYLGFDDSTSGFKVLNIRVNKFRSSTRKVSAEVRILDLGSSDSSWRKKIDPLFPFDVIGNDWLFGCRESVCVKSAIHWILWEERVILAFDLREEIFRIIPLPSGAVPLVEPQPPPVGFTVTENNKPYMIHINGKLGIISQLLDSMELLILEDYENRIWIGESIQFPFWAGLDSWYPRYVKHTGEILLKPKRMRRDCVCLPFYDMKKGSFRIVDIGLAPELLAPDVEITFASDYIESIVGLRRNG